MKDQCEAVVYAPSEMEAVRCERRKGGHHRHMARVMWVSGATEKLVTVEMVWTS